jgi:CheY-like chemotaxis protein
MKKSVVLVIEDDPLLLQAIKRKLEVSECEVVTSPTGKGGIEYLNNQPSVKPDVIWLDYYLTDMNGLEFMNILKKDPRFTHIPIVVVSNSASDEKVHAMLALGADKYILKADHKLEEIVTTVKSMTAPKEGGQELLS